MTARRLSVCALATAASLLAACSSDPAKPLRTDAQAAKFRSAVVHGDDPAKWHLAPSATASAAQAWKNRSLLQDLGNRLRTEGTWACLIAEESGVFRQHGIFSQGDREPMIAGARAEGIPMEKITLMFHDVTALPGDELIALTEAICPPPKVTGKSEQH